MKTNTINSTRYKGCSTSKWIFFFFVTAACHRPLCETGRHPVTIYPSNMEVSKFGQCGVIHVLVTKGAKPLIFTAE
jgi:hypothetical protein